jgi:hypothetical protein
VTRETFDLIIIALIAVGLIAAALRLRADFTRPLPEDDDPVWAQDDTQPRR